MDIMYFMTTVLFIVSKHTRSMFCSNKLSGTILSIVFIITSANARKYDIESESNRIYGEDFSTILNMFRRSPDYLQILEQKYDELILFFGEVATYALQYTMDHRLRARVAEACGFEEITSTTLVYYMKAHNRRQAEETSTTNLALETTKDPIGLLERYPHFSNVLSTQERNNFRNLAFEITGQMIHQIIKGMGPVMDPGSKSTRPLKEEDDPLDLTTHNDNHKHLITIHGQGTEDATERETTNPYVAWH